MLAAINGMEFGEAMTTLMDKKYCGVSYRLLRSITGMSNVTISKIKQGSELNACNVVSICLGLHLSYKVSDYLLNLAGIVLDDINIDNNDCSIYKQLLQFHWAENYKDIYDSLCEEGYESLLTKP